MVSVLSLGIAYRLWLTAASREQAGEPIRSARRKHHSLLLLMWLLLRLVALPALMLVLLVPLLFLLLLLLRDAGSVRIPPRASHAPGMTARWLYSGLLVLFPLVFLLQLLAAVTAAEGMRGLPLLWRKGLLPLGHRALRPLPEAPQKFSRAGGTRKRLRFSHTEILPFIRR